MSGPAPPAAPKSFAGKGLRHLLGQTACQKKAPRKGGDSNL